MNFYFVLSNPCDTLHGVGPALATKLKQCGIHTLQDLIFHLPYRYQDRTRITPIRDASINEWCVVAGRICKIEIKQGKRPMLYCYVEDKTGLLRLRFFHFYKQQITQFNNNPWIQAFGEVRGSATILEMIHPEYQLIDEGTVCQVEEHFTPIYASTQGLSQYKLRELITKTLDTHLDDLNALEWMSEAQRLHFQVDSMPKAIKTLHHPNPETQLSQLENGQHPSLKRIIIDELLGQLCSLNIAKLHRQNLKAPIFPSSFEQQNAFLTQLPFQLTNAQHRVVLEIINDLNQPTPMMRLVQGDVGSGKTVVAAAAALTAMHNHHQVALMAPTELLSEQHFKNFSLWFANTSFKILYLTGSMKKSARMQCFEALKHHECDLLIGTHALFQESVDFARLGLVMIDEQHRFGVEQRAKLWQKGQINNTIPHQLLMTATPIPRTLAMTHYADLDLSIIDELPPGRTPVQTAVLHEAKRAPIIERLKHTFLNQQQAYWVCVLIDESEKIQCVNATQTAENLKVLLPQARIGLIHGQMRAQEKEDIMKAFKDHHLDLLVATTVIEVGVDVPNANIMIIENAERLGLSQLHQLRGRVGRGSQQAYCVLMYQTPLSNTARMRLNTLRDTTDGFVIAEKDWALRGSGSLLGTQQTGYKPYKIANLQRDAPLLHDLSALAKSLVIEDPNKAHIIAKRWLGAYQDYLNS